MASYFLSPALAQLRSQVNARWPGRDKTSDGWIGDASHAARTSDHNPDWDSDGIVRAIDIDKDGIDVDWLISVATSDDRTAYVIWNRRIWNRSTGRWSAYTGANPHDKHVHISVRHGGPDRDARAWGAGAVSNPIGGGGSAPTVPGVSAPNPIAPEDDMTPDQVKKLDEIHWMLGQVRATDLPPIAKHAYGAHAAGDLAVAGNTNAINGILAVKAGVNALAAKAGVDVKELSTGISAALAPVLTQAVTAAIGQASGEDINAQSMQTAAEAAIRQVLGGLDDPA